MSDIQALIDGFKAFHQEYVEDKDGVYKGLAQYGPHSKILMIASCDSRVDPAIITNSSAGDLMVIRNIGNLVPPYMVDSAFQETQAAIEFAVCYLHVEHIIVMGHSRCAGIRSVLTRVVDDSDPVSPLEKWTSIIEPTAREVMADMPDSDLDEQACACSRRALAVSLKNLEEYPWIKEHLDKQQIELHGWYFNLSDGMLERYNEEEKKFELLY